MESPGRGTCPLGRRRELQALEDVTCPFMGLAPLEPTDPRGFIINGTHCEEDVILKSQRPEVFKVLMGRKMSLGPVKASAV